MRLRLSKWYLDVVSSRGDVFIGYSASLQGTAVSIAHQSALVHRVDDGTTIRTSLCHHAPPVLQSHGLEWRPRAIGTSGTWRRISAPVLYRSGFVVAALFGIVAAFALGVDFPESNRRFARLA